MDTNEFRRDQYLTLRDEIKSIKNRLFWIVIFGLFGVPTLAYFAAKSERFVALLVPYFVLALILAFLAEQNALMRAGRFIREEIEQPLGGMPGWEAWLESHQTLRLMDKHFFACFIIVFFVYYFMTIGMAMQKLWDDAANDPAGQYWQIGASVTYAVGAIWALATLFQHWRSLVRTTDRARG